MKNRRRVELLATTMLAVAGLASAPAHAQTTAQDQAPPSQPEPSAPPSSEQTPEKEIVVTGTLIARPNLQLSTPVITTTADAVQLKQSNTAEQVIRELPGVVPNIGNAVNNGNTGTSYVDLRGLGSNRNIVLLDGKRIVPDDATGRVDLNSIPLALLDRVDALTGAAVTTYGADAVTGVVNFVTKRRFSGVELLASQQITERGDGSTFRIDGSIGGNFADDRGNAVLSLGYQHANPIYQGDREFSRAQIDSYSGTELGSGTSIPSRFSGTRGLTGGVPNTGAQYVQTGTSANGTPILGLRPGGAANGGVRQLNASGAAVGTYQFFNFNPYNIFQTPFERFNIYGAASYKLSDSVEIYGRGLYSKNTVTTIVAPSGAFGAPVTINLNNPYLPATLRQQFCALNVAPAVVGLDAGGASVSGQTAYQPQFTPAECAAAATATGRTDPNYREVTVTLNRRSVEFGSRIQEFKLDLFDYRAGVRGTLTSRLNYDINGSYGKNDNVLTQSNYVLASRLRQGLLVNGTRATPVCQNTANNCVPLDVFSVDPSNVQNGLISPSARDFVTAQSSAFRGSSLLQGQALVTGDVGLTLPAASEPISIAAGAEYRRYRAYQRADFLSSQAGELGGAGGAILAFNGGYSVVEGYGEVVAPLVEDRPFFHSLTFEGGLRYSSYTVSSANSPKFDTWTWKAGGSWEPVRGLKFRGNYSRAARAPNVFELFNPPATGLTNLAVDPCAGAAPATNANLRAVCLAQGAPVNTIGSINNPTAAQANVTSSGNLNLKPEKATTYTLGAVWQPDFLRGFNVSVDYYNIKVRDAIGEPLPGDLIAACFGAVTAASATNPACTVIRRNRLTGALDGDPSIAPGLFSQQSNLGQLSTDGIDVIANYTRSLGEVGLNLSFVGNWTHSSKFKASPTAINRECASYYSVNCSFTGSIQPKFQFSQRTTLTFGPADLSLLWRWIDHVQFEPQQFTDDVAAAQAGGCADPAGADPEGCVVDPPTGGLGRAVTSI